VSCDSDFEIESYRYQDPSVNKTLNRHVKVLNTSRLGDLAGVTVSFSCLGATLLFALGNSFKISSVDWRHHRRLKSMRWERFLHDRGFSHVAEGAGTG
jgi:hypothetical protein